MEEYPIVAFSIVRQEDGSEHPTQEQQKIMTERLAPIKEKAEKEITAILKKIEKEHSIIIWTDYKHEMKLRFIYPCYGFKEI
mgnify:CR=1 FL=1